MPLKYKIRKAEISDIDRIYEIELKCFPHPWPIEGFRNELNVSHSRVFVAEADDIVIGYIVTWLILNELHVQKIGVVKDYRRKGIGTALINYPAGMYADFISVIMLEVREKNKKARRFYAELGFTEKGFRKNYYPDDNAILIEKEIN